MELIDTHSHLYLDQFKEDLDEVVQRCEKHQVKKVLLPNIDSTTIQPLHNIVDRYPDMFIPMMGLHPCSVKENYEEELQIIEKKLRGNGYVAVGEIGLDYHWDTTFKKEQIEAFKRQVEWAKRMNLPIAIHCRKSFDEVVNILKDIKDERLKGVFHCFTGTVEDAQKVIGLGFYMGIGGVVTFKNAGLDKALENIDLEHIILETDSPYLTPVPYRGKRNESSYVKFIAEKIAEIKKISVEEVSWITNDNAKRLFNF